MKIQSCYIEGLFIIEPKVYLDERGFFYEFFNREKFKKQTGMEVNWLQDNLAKSQKNTLRGFHFQKEPFAQAKLVSVLKGSVLDVVVDLRKNSTTFGKHFAIELTETNKLQLFIPRGFAHAYLTLEDETLFFYKIDNAYHPESESGIRYNDPDLKINWPVQDVILSHKDQQLPFFKNIIDEL